MLLLTRLSLVLGRTDSILSLLVLSFPDSPYRRGSILPSSKQPFPPGSPPTPWPALCPCSNDWAVLIDASVQASSCVLCPREELSEGLPHLHTFRNTCRDVQEGTSGLSQRSSTPLGRTRCPPSGTTGGGEGQGHYLKRPGSCDALWRWQRGRRWRGDHSGGSGSSCQGWVLLQPRDTNGRGCRAQECQCHIGAGCRTDKEGALRGPRQQAG